LGINVPVMYRILIKIKRFVKRFLKVKSETRQVISARLSSKIYKYLMLFAAVALISLLYPAEDLFRPLDFPRQGEMVQKNIIAPFRIIISKSENELQEEKKAAAGAIPVV